MSETAADHERRSAAITGPVDGVPTRAAASAREVVAWGALVAFLALSRWLVAPLVLHDWDAANYALASQSFDVFEHQPHPPGYPLFVAALKVFGAAGGDIVAPFLLVNAILGGMALVLMGWMVRARAGPVGAWLMAAAFAVSPQFWYHGAATTAYVAESFCSVLVGATAWALAGRRIGWSLAGVLFAVAVGIRPNALVTLAPVATLALVLARPGATELVRLVGTFGGIVVVWCAPLVLFGGGWSRYREATAAISIWQLNYGSALGGDPTHLIRNAVGLATYLFDALNLGWLLLASNLFLLLVFRTVPWRDLALLLAWFLPGAAFYSVHHLPKSGYVLTLSPILFVSAALLTGTAAMGMSQPRRRLWLGAQGLVIATYLLVNTGAFFASVPRELLLYRDARIGLPPVLVLTGDYGVRGLRYSTWAHDRTRELVSTLDPERDVAVFLFGAHELHRVQMWYHPSHWTIATSVDHGIAFSSRAPEPTFGELQLTLLRPPPRGHPTWSEVTTLSHQGRTLRLERAGRRLDLPFDRRPEHVLVFYPCAPCDVLVGEGLVEQGRPGVGAGYGATLLVPIESATPTPAP